MKRQTVSRRACLQASLCGLWGLSSSGWLPALADAVASNPQRRRQCILLWMGGGPSQLDTFDLKPGHENGGEFKEISTTVPGLRISEHLPRLAEQAEHLSVLRSVSTREGDHQRGTYLMRTGRRPGSPVNHPCIGSSVARVLWRDDLTLPGFVSVNPATQIAPEAFSPGFLGPKYAAATVGEADAGANPNGPPTEGFASLKVDNLARPAGLGDERTLARLSMWQDLQDDFLREHPASLANAQDIVYRRALDLIDSDQIAAFDLEQESDEVRTAYGRGRFGQGCLLARRLIERGVPIVEVTLGNGIGWDTHQQNFPAVRRLSSELDAGFAMLLQDLQQRGLLETTTILWMGEFGRTPQINEQGGRDHFPNAWTCVFAGGGVQGGGAVGKTSDDGMEVVDDKADQADVLATLCHALGVDPSEEQIDGVGRPHRIAEGRAIGSILS